MVALGAMFGGFVERLRLRVPNLRAIAYGVAAASSTGGSSPPPWRARPWWLARTTAIRERQFESWLDAEEPE